MQEFLCLRWATPCVCLKLPLFDPLLENASMRIEEGDREQRA